jgi:2-oxoglutarate dehydrogenase E2 component (dihydrolipoamide succinyltransferase)
MATGADPVPGLVQIAGGQLTSDADLGDQNPLIDGQNPSASGWSPTLTDGVPGLAAESLAEVSREVTTTEVTDRPQRRVRLSHRRQVIAQRLMEAQQTAAMLTTFNEVDMTAILTIRSNLQDDFRARHGVRLGLMSFFTKAAVSALKHFPNVNAELQDKDLILKEYYDINVAVNTADGLVVPVVRNADRLSFAGIELEIERLAQAARNRTLNVDDLVGGTFTITNGGVFGNLFSTPIRNVPQVGILGMHKIMDRPIAVSGQVVVRPMMYIALSYDHRVIDGAESVGFLASVKKVIEDPNVLLVE